MAKHLVVLAGPDEGRSFALGGDIFLLGRSRATESRLIDPHVSRVHCQIQPEGEAFVISDFDSPAGTYVNGKRISKQPLQAGDLIRIGNTRLQFLDDPNAPATPTVPLSGKVTAIMPDWPRKLSGQTIKNYKVGPLLGRGKTGFVFHAKDTKRNLDVALKILNPERLEDEKLVNRFVEAMKAVLPLRHPNLLKVHGAGKTGPYCWVATEYVAGENLAAVIGRIESAGKLDWRNVFRVMVYLARALDYAHKKKLIHQCVTPQNILLGKNVSETKLTDLMLAFAIERDPSLPINDAGEPSDDLAYMPPERTDGPKRPVDARTDLYSLGATIYGLLSGQPPFQAATARELVEKIRLQAPVSLKNLYAGLPASFEALIQKCMAKRPEDRPQSALELLGQLDRIGVEHAIAD